MAEFEKFIKSERERLSERRNELKRQRDELDRQIQDVENEFAAVDAYERVRKGQSAAAKPAASRRRTGVRETVLNVVKRHGSGISRGDILVEMSAKGDKRAEQSISNALSNLKKQGTIRLEQGQYTAAG